MRGKKRFLFGRRPGKQRGWCELNVDQQTGKPLKTSGGVKHWKRGTKADKPHWSRAGRADGGKKTSPKALKAPEKRDNKREKICIKWQTQTMVRTGTFKNLPRPSFRLGEGVPRGRREETNRESLGYSDLIEPTNIGNG